MTIDNLIKSLKALRKKYGPHVEVVKIYDQPNPEGKRYHDKIDNVKILHDSTRTQYAIGLD